MVKKEKLMMKGHKSASFCFKRRFTSYFHQLKMKAENEGMNTYFKKLLFYFNTNSVVRKKQVI